MIGTLLSDFPSSDLRRCCCCKRRREAADTTSVSTMLSSLQDKSQLRLSTQAPIFKLIPTSVKYAQGLHLCSWLLIKHHQRLCMTAVKGDKQWAVSHLFEEVALGRFRISPLRAAGRCGGQLLPSNSSLPSASLNHTGLCSCNSTKE